MSLYIKWGYKVQITDLLLLCSILNIFRQLRGQQRIQLHICLFLSFILTCILKILWDLLVYNDRIHHPWKLTFMVKYEVRGFNHLKSEQYYMSGETAFPTRLLLRPAITQRLCYAITYSRQNIYSELPIDRISVGRTESWLGGHFLFL